MHPLITYLTGHIDSILANIVAILICYLLISIMYAIFKRIIKKKFPDSSLWKLTGQNLSVLESYEGFSKYILAVFFGFLFSVITNLDRTVVVNQTASLVSATNTLTTPWYHQRFNVKINERHNLVLTLSAKGTITKEELATDAFDSDTRTVANIYFADHFAQGFAEKHALDLSALAEENTSEETRRKLVLEWANNYLQFLLTDTNLTVKFDKRFDAAVTKAKFERLRVE